MASLRCMASCVGFCNPQAKKLVSAKVWCKLIPKFVYGWNGVLLIKMSFKNVNSYGAVDEMVY